jgi:hypothetical protein
VSDLTVGDIFDSLERIMGIRTDVRPVSMPDGTTAYSHTFTYAPPISLDSEHFYLYIRPDTYAILIQAYEEGENERRRRTFLRAAHRRARQSTQCRVKRRVPR